MDSVGNSVEASRRIRPFHDSLPVLAVVAISTSPLEELRNELYTSELGLSRSCLEKAYIPFPCLESRGAIKHPLVLLIA